MSKVVKKIKITNELLKIVHDKLIMSRGIDIPQYDLQTKEESTLTAELLEKRYMIMKRAMDRLEAHHPFHYKAAMKSKPRDDLLFPKELRAFVEDV